MLKYFIVRFVVVQKGLTQYFVEKYGDIDSNNTNFVITSFKIVFRSAEYLFVPTIFLKLHQYAIQIILSPRVDG